MAPERDSGDLPPVQPSRRLAVVRGLHPRLWARRVLPRGGAPRDEAEEGGGIPPAKPGSDPEAPLTYDDQAHLHGGPGSRPRMDLEE